MKRTKAGVQIMKQLGIFGGTFDPPHIGHLIVAQTALCELRLDKVLFVPCGNPPHKTGRKITDAAHRLAMVRGIIRGNEEFEISDLEIVKGTPSYTAETLKELQQLMPDTALTFIVGADSLAYMKRWWQPEEIFSRCTVAVAVRSLIQGQELKKAIAECEKLYHAKICTLHMPVIDISSSEIRESDSLEKFRYLIPDGVMEYIKKYQLYGKC